MANPGVYSGVAIGSSIGHAIGGLFSGGSGAPAEQPQQQQAVQSQQAETQQRNWGNNCAEATKQFTTCMDEQNGNMQICGWYLEQLVRYSPGRRYMFCYVRADTVAFTESLPGCGQPVLSYEVERGEERAGQSYFVGWSEREQSI